MSVKEYLEDHIVLITGEIILLLLQSVLLSFAGMETGLVVILTMAWILITCVVLVCQYISRRKFMKQIKLDIEHMDQKYLLHEVIPKYGSNEYMFYRDMLRIGNKSMLENISSIRRERQEYQEFVEQWVHEIKTPIAAMKLWSENQEGERKRELLRQLERTEHYVEQALFYARSENVEKDFRIQRTDVSACISEALLQSKYSCRSAGIGIDIQVEDCIVYTDEKWLIFIISQLIENAVKYRKEQGACIRIWNEDIGKVRKLMMEDNGKGIRATDLPRIFEKGFTGENGRSADSHSTGIGLYLCKKLCEAMNIDIQVESVEKEYTRIILSFSDVLTEL